MTKKRKFFVVAILTCIVIFVVAFSIILTNIIATKSFKISKIISQDSEFTIYKEMLFEKTPQGDYYLHTFKGDPVKLDNPPIGIEKSFINDLSEDYRFLSEDDLKRMNNSVSYYFNKSFATYVDKNGDLYFKINQDMKDKVSNPFDNSTSSDFCKISSVSDVKKVECTDTYNCCIVILTKNGKVMIARNFNHSTAKDFTELKTDEKITDIKIDSSTILALGENGTLFQCGNEYNDPSLLLSSSDNFIVKLRNVKYFDFSMKRVIALRENGKVYCFGGKYTSKGSGHFVCYKIKGLYHADKILNDYNSVYIFEEGKIYKKDI